MKIARLCLLVMSFALALLACSPAADIDSPPEIVYGEDMCVQCGMIISEPRYAAAYLSVDGEPRIFDDLGELCLYHRDHQEKMATVWAHDFHSEAWIDAEAATFVMSENIHTPMSFGIVAFRDREDAALFAEEMQGQLHDFNSFLKACQGNSQGHDHG